MASPAEPTVLVARHGSDEAAAFRAGVEQVWEQAFGPIPDVGDWRSSIWDRHRQRADYRLVTALDPAGALVGFGWGYTGEPGQFWSDLVLDRLGPAVADWVGGHFEFVELAVSTDARGHGLGGRLHDALLADLPHDRALLGTSADPTDPAVRLYRSRGWQTLGHQSPGNQVMGLRLKPQPG